MTADVLPEGYDFTDPDVNWEAIPHEQFQALRLNAPMFWVEQPAVLARRDGRGGGTGYWAVSKHADVAAVSKDSKDFSAPRTARSSASRRACCASRWRCSA